MRMKNILMAGIGTLGFVAFLVLCSEPAPGEDITLWQLVWPKIIAMGVLGLSAWGIDKLDKMTIR